MQIVQNWSNPQKQLNLFFIKFGLKCEPKKGFVSFPCKIY